MPGFDASNKNDNDYRMKSYFRFLSKNKLYIVVEVIGISIAFAFLIPLLSFREDKWSIDHGPDYRNIYAVCPVGTFETTMGLGSELRQTVPEVEQFAQVHVCPETDAFFAGNDIRATGLAVNAGFFDLFETSFLDGGASSLADRHSALISKSLASKVDENPIARSFLYGGEEYMVSGIFDDFHDSLLPPTDILFNIEAPMLDAHWKSPDGYWDDTYTFIKVQEGIKKRPLFEKCKNACMAYYSSYYAQHPDNQKNIKIVRYDKISSNINNNGLTQTWGLSLWAVELFGLVLLVFAMLNYINLTVALSLKRGKEWSMKKLLGLSGMGVSVSLFLETLLVTLFCFLAGFLLSQAIVPVFNEFFLATHTYIELNALMTWRKGLFYGAFILVLSGLSSMIPALISYRYAPIDVVSGKYRKTIKGSAGNLLIGIQCFLTVLLLSVSTLLFAQYRKMTTRPRGRMAENIYVISGNYTNEALTLAANALRSLPFVRHVGKSNDCPGDGRYARVTVLSPDGTRTPLYIIKCDEESFKAFGFHIEKDAPISEGLWLSGGAMRELTLHGAGTDYGIVQGRPIEHVSGTLSDFVVNLESDVHAGVEITESFDFNRLVINTTGKSKEYAETILETFKEAILQTNVLYSPPVDHGYLERFWQKSVQPTQSILSMLALYTFFSLVLSILGLVAMSIYYVSLHQKDSAIRKVYGSTTREEIVRNMAIYLKTVLIAGALGLMLSMVINGVILQNYSYRLSATFWIYLLVIVFIAGVATLSVYSQVSRVLSKNPIRFLRSE